MITEDTTIVGQKYRVIRNPPSFSRTDLINKIGIAKWANGRGVCLKFEEQMGYVIPFDCIAKVETYEKPKYIFREVPKHSNVIRNQFRYRLSNFGDNIFGDNLRIDLLGRIGTLCKILWSGKDNLCEVCFEDGWRGVIYLNCLEDVGS